MKKSGNPAPGRRRNPGAGKSGFFMRAATLVVGANLPPKPRAGVCACKGCAESAGKVGKNEKQSGKRCHFELDPYKIRVKMEVF